MSNSPQTEETTGRLLHTGDNLNKMRKQITYIYQQSFIYMDPACYWATSIPKSMSRSVSAFCSNSKNILSTLIIPVVAERAETKRSGLSELYCVPMCCVRTYTSIAFTLINMHLEHTQVLKLSGTICTVYLSVIKLWTLLTHYIFMLFVNLALSRYHVSCAWSLTHSRYYGEGMFGI
jgi:hypothetical protein